MPGVAGLVARLRGCPADCTFWAGDSVEWRDPRMGRPWNPTGRVVGPSDLPRDAWPPADDATGDEILRGAIGAVVGAQSRVLVDWRGTPDAGVHNTPTAWLRHTGPCPALFAPGATTRIERPILGDLMVGDVVRVTGIAASGVLTVQAADGRHGEAYRSQLATPFVGPRAP